VGYATKTEVRNTADRALPALVQAASIIQIAGHTDSEDTDSYNMPLTPHRAEAAIV
jgi:outer membrane protein OmpA-like peptidoglycan-associated protein